MIPQVQIGVSTQDEWVYLTDSMGLLHRFNGVATMMNSQVPKLGGGGGPLCHFPTWEKKAEPVELCWVACTYRAPREALYGEDLPTSARSPR